MAKYTLKCFECGKDFENHYEASPQLYCSVACQLGGADCVSYTIPLETTTRSVKAQRPEPPIQNEDWCTMMTRTEMLHIDNIRASFDPKLSSKANVLQLLKLAGDKGSHYDADIALLTLINDPDIMAAYFDVYREYD